MKSQTNKQVEAQWKEVAGFPNYECSTDGQYRQKNSVRLLNGTSVHNGYKHIGLTHYGKQVTKLHHRLIAETWLNKPSPDHCIVHHINHNRTDNRIANLQWVTRSYNSKHRQAKLERCKCCNQPIYSKN